MTDDYRSVVARERVKHALGALADSAVDEEAIREMIRILTEAVAALNARLAKLRGARSQRA